MPTPIWKQPGYNPRTDDNNNYGFIPSKSIGFSFLIIFSILTFLHLIFVFKTRKWWLVAMVLGGIVEIIGWSGRLWGAYNPDNDNSFLIQIVCLIFAPAFLGGAIYAMMKWVIMAVGPQYSWLKPQNYWRIFITCDFVSLVVQSGGGGIASGADNDQSQTDLGSNIMLAGIIFQLIATIAFSIFFILFLRSFARDPQVDRKSLGKVRQLLWAIAISAVAIVIRGIYRTVELAQKWNGFLFVHQVWFLWDALPMVILMIVTLVFHPYFTLFPFWSVGDPPIVQRYSSDSTEKVLDSEREMSNV